MPLYRMARYVEAGVWSAGGTGGFLAVDLVDLVVLSFGMVTVFCLFFVVF